jgi:phosphatidylglycerophosphatase A
MIWRCPIQFLAFGFGFGALRPAPGTWGTIPGLLFYPLFAKLPVSLYLLLIGLMTIAGVYLCGKTSEQLKVHDHPGIVWDEIVGFLLTMTSFAPSFFNLCLGFLFFRFFDILKPWPIRTVDKLVKGGFGIMLDDLLAAIYAWLCLYLSLKLFT